MPDTTLGCVTQVRQLYLSADKSITKPRSQALHLHLGSPVDEPAHQFPIWEILYPCTNLFFLSYLTSTMTGMWNTLITMLVPNTKHLQMPMVLFFFPADLAQLQPPAPDAGQLHGWGQHPLCSQRWQHSQLHLLHDRSAFCWGPCPTVSPGLNATPVLCKAREVEGLTPEGSCT